MFVRCVWQPSINENDDGDVIYSLTAIRSMLHRMLSQQVLCLVQNKSVEGVETVLSELEETCTITILTDVLSSSSSSSAKPGDSASLTPDEQQSNVHAILNSMSQTLSTSVETRIAYHYELVFSSNLRRNVFDAHRRSQNFVWGALFSSKKLTTFFSRHPWKTV